MFNNFEDQRSVTKETWKALFSLSHGMKLKVLGEKRTPLKQKHLEEVEHFTND